MGTPAIPAKTTSDIRMREPSEALQNLNLSFIITCPIRSVNASVTRTIAWSALGSLKPETIKGKDEECAEEAEMEVNDQGTICLPCPVDQNHGHPTQDAA